MLAPQQVIAGTLADAKGMALMLPRRRYEHPILVVTDGEGHRAIFLEEHFPTFECSGNTHYTGMVIPAVRIELDPASLFDPSGYSLAGTLIRSGTELAICASPQDRYSGGRAARICIQTGLPPCGGNECVGFGRWKIVVGEGREKQVLHEVAIEVPAELR